MKKVLLAASIASALSLFNVAQAANNGTITFNGTITDQTCAVVIDGGAATQTVTLPATSKNLLSGTNSSSSETPFKFSVSGCTASATAWGVQPYFVANATNINATDKLLRNLEPAATAATNVELQLLFGSDNAVVPLGAAPAHADYASHFKAMSSTDTTANFDYVVRYYSKAGGASAGKVLGMVDYVLMYN